jgi:twitching motility protein PilT
MQLVRNGLVSYDEAHRQSTNPDDFALRFSGISGTSDSKWDDFDAKAGEVAAVPGTQAFAQRGAPAAAAALQHAATGGPIRPPAGPQAPQRAMTPAAPRPAAAAPPAPAAAPKPASDDFEIERF